MNFGYRRNGSAPEKISVGKLRAFFLEAVPLHCFLQNFCIGSSGKLKINSILKESPKSVWKQTPKVFLKSFAKNLLREENLTESALARRVFERVILKNW